MIEHFLSLGVTSIELLPVHAFATEPRLLQHGLANYWGYNSLNFFTPHGAYATEESRRQGPEAILREFKGMVKLLHQAGLEVILDVVYNHTAEEGIGGPRTSLRGIDNRSYYRQQDDGAYIDVTGCGNSVNTSTDAAARLVLDSLRYWANDVQIDGFRFDLAATLGRDAAHHFTPDHPLLRAIVDDPALAGVKKISEPWDVGMGGWQTGNFGDGWHEWNDRYRDRVRNFWLSDVDYARRASTAPVGIGGFATRLAGSANTFSVERGPLASVNFVTAHDGFTLRDLVSYDVKHNLGNGEQNRDGADTNRSFNHGAEGATSDEGILATRRKAMRNLLGTLLLSAGIPMLTAGDEFGRTQRGNNNAYCHDSPLTWLSWDHAPWQEDLFAHVQRLIRLRSENPALRPSRFAQARRAHPVRVGDGLVRRERRDDVDRPVDQSVAPHTAVRRGLHARERGVQPHPADRPRQRAPVDVTLPEIDGRDRVRLAVVQRGRGAERRHPSNSSRVRSSRSPARRCSCSAPSERTQIRRAAGCPIGRARGRFETWSRRRAPRAPAPGAAPLHPGPSGIRRPARSHDGNPRRIPIALSLPSVPGRRCSAQGVRGRGRSVPHDGIPRGPRPHRRARAPVLAVRRRIAAPPAAAARRLRPVGDRRDAARSRASGASGSRRSPTTSPPGSTPPT